MDLTKILKLTPIEPVIECDGGYYAQCNRCYAEIKPTDCVCPKCNQVQDWSWFRKDDKYGEN